jgi:heme oxygenase (mycobilin-producing)
MYVSVSHLAVDPARAAEVIAAFGQRAHLVDDVPGFQRLEVWQGREPGEIMMVSWWSDRPSFTAYMRSAEHRCSHDRIPEGLLDSIRLERLEHLTGYEVVAR